MVERVVLNGVAYAGLPPDYSGHEHPHRHVVRASKHLDSNDACLGQPGRYGRRG